MLPPVTGKKGRHPFIILRRLSKGGGDLIDIAIATFVIVALITAVLATATTYKHIRKTQLQNTATKLASKKIEELRNQASLPSNVTDQQTAVTELPSGYLHLTVADPSPPQFPSIPNLKLITVKMTWSEQGANQEVTLNSMITR